MVKKLPANADTGDLGSSPGSGRSPGRGTQSSILSFPRTEKPGGLLSMELQSQT